MREIPMLDSDRENLRAEFGEEFDNMTLAELKAASRTKTDEMLDLYNALAPS